MKKNIFFTVILKLKFGDPNSRSLSGRGSLFKIFRRKILKREPLHKQNFYTRTKGLLFTYSPVFLALLLLAACTSNPTEREMAVSFYHWKASFSPSMLENAFLNELGVKKLFVRYFDVDLEVGEPAPLSIIHWKSMPDTGCTIVPVVFITDRCMRVLNEEAVDSLAKNIFFKINELHPDGRKLKEIQLDCDWTEGSRYAFFRLIKKIRDWANDCTISVTLRLHQMKHFRKTGVPPSDYVVLMFYNMGNISDIRTQNSILDPKIGKDYIENSASYPLKWELALPLFSWGVLFRDGKLIKLMNQLEVNELSDTSKFISTDGLYFRVRKETILRGHFLYVNDTIRLEVVSPDLLQESAEVLIKHSKFPESRIIYYHLDSNIVKKISYETLRSQADSFSVHH